MERYPQELTSLLSPLVVFQGLGTDEQLQRLSHHPNRQDQLASSDASIKLAALQDQENPLHAVSHANAEPMTREFPIVQAATGLELVSALSKFNTSHDYWYSNLSAPLGHKGSNSYNYNIKFVDESYRLPEKISKPKVPVVSHAVTEDGVEVPEVETQTHISSQPLSPFNPDSKYKDEVCSLYWVQKYTEMNPFVFISVHELDIDATGGEAIRNADVELAKDIIKAKEKVVSKGIRFLSIILCSRSTILNADLDERIELLRKQTGLPSRTGLLFLPAGTQRELDAFVLSVMNLIKPWMVEYYNSIQKYIKRRVVKEEVLKVNYPLTFWTARQAFKQAVLEEIKGISDSSVKAFEFTYESLIEATRSVPTMSESSWKNIRLLLDFVGYHITRSYLLLGDANMAYKKFDIHIQNVLPILQLKQISIKSYPVLSWLSLQITWLAQLCELAPESIVPIERAWQPYTLQNSRWHQASEIPSNNIFSMPQSGYLFLQAVSLIRRRKLASKQSIKGAEHLDNYMSLTETEEQKFDYSPFCIKLLGRALDCFSRAKKSKFNRSESFIYFQIGEEYFKMKNFAMAVNNYIIALSILKNEHWNMLVSVVLYRLYESSLKLQNFDYALQYYLQFCALDVKRLNLTSFTKMDPDTVFSGDEEVNFRPESGLGLFKSSINFQKSEAFLSDEIRLQLFLQLDANQFLSDMKVDSITIEIEGSPYTVLIHNDDSLEQRKHYDLGVAKGDATSMNIEYKASLEFSSNSEKVLELGFHSSKVGKFSIESVSLRCSMNKLHFNYSIPLSRSQWTERFKWYKPSINGSSNLQYDIITLKDPFVVDVSPDDPKTTVTMDYAKVAYASELYDMTLDIMSEDVIEYGLQIEALTTIDSEIVESYWDGHDSKKDGLGSLLEAPLLSNGDRQTYTLKIVIPGKLQKDGRLKVVFNITYLVDNNPEAKVIKAETVMIETKRAFSTMTIISPRRREDDISSVFYIDADSTTFPPLKRFWCSGSKLTYFDEYEGEEEIEIVGYDFAVKSKSSNDQDVQVVDLVADVNKDASSFTLKKGEYKDLNVHFVTSNSDSRRVIAIEIMLTIEWKKKLNDSDTINKYTETVWKGNLSLLDPRALVNIVRSEHDPKMFVLEYMIENPTANIFQFSSSLFESDNFRILGVRNNNFSVLPFMTQILRYEVYILNDYEKSLKLPECKIYDLNYKVYLTPLSINEEIKLGKEGLYIVNPSVL